MIHGFFFISVVIKDWQGKPEVTVEFGISPMCEKNAEVPVDEDYKPFSVDVHHQFQIIAEQARVISR